MLSNKGEFNFTCSLKNLQIVRDFVRKELDSQQVSDLIKNQIVLAVDEVCANLIIHSNQNDDSKEIKLSLQLLKTPKGISIEFKENGEPFDYLQYQEPSLNEIIESQSAGKMGLMLVRRIMDEIEYIRQGNYNVCRLYKSLA
jgi:serine/threonine-protein kinase RsbW